MLGFSDVGAGCVARTLDRMTVCALGRGTSRLTRVACKRYNGGTTMHFHKPTTSLIAVATLLPLPMLAFSQGNADTDDEEALEEIIVTGTSKARASFVTPFSAAQLDEERLNNFTYNSQADLLRFVPGIKAEGGGGEVATNVFIKGLPSGGQFQFTPLLYDGMPSLSTFGLNSSAFDVYYRNDLGVEQMEFVRGGVSNLFGPGSVAGIINYISKRGSDTPETQLQLELAEEDRLRADFANSGPLSRDSDIYYAVSGYYRYDEGPLDTGLPTDGYQLRGNIMKEFEDGSGSITFYGQLIDDKVQFFLPFPLDGSSRDRTVGNDGTTVFTVQTSEAQELNFQTPAGTFRTPIRDGVVTDGGSFGVALDKDLGNDWGLNARGRFARYDHQFNLFLDGDGIANTPETLDGFLATRNLGDIADATYTFTESGRAVPSSDLLFANRLLDRDRPVTDFSGELNLTKTVVRGNVEHNLTLGGFFARTEADDDNVITTYLAEFNDRPRLVDLSVIDTTGAISGTVGTDVIVSHNGLLNAGVSFSNKTVEARRTAVYIADQIETDRFVIDVGVRVEEMVADVNFENSESFLVDQAVNLGPNQALHPDLENIVFGNGSFTAGRVDTTEWAAAAGVLYKFSDDWNFYGNLSRGFFFPQGRSVKFNDFGEPQSYEGEIITQAEIGVKYSGDRIAATLAAFYSELDDRANVDFVNDGMGGVIELTSLQSTESKGIELGGSVLITDYLTFEGNVTYQDHELTKNEGDPTLVGNELRRQPNILANAGLYFNNNNFDAALFGNFVGDNFANDGNTVELDSFSIWRIEGGYTFNFADNSKLRISLTVFNVTDDEGTTEGSPRQGTAQSATGLFFVGRPILPQRTTLKINYSF